MVRLQYSDRQGSVHHVRQRADQRPTEAALAWACIYWLVLGKTSNNVPITHVFKGMISLSECLCSRCLKSVVTPFPSSSSSFYLYNQNCLETRVKRRECAISNGLPGKTFIIPIVLQI